MTEPAEVVLLPSLGRGTDDFDLLATALGAAALLPIALGPSSPAVVPRSAARLDFLAGSTG